MSTVSAQQKDSIDFSIDESRAVVDAWLTLPKFVQINDSLKKANEILESQINDCEDLKGSYREQNKNYQFYAETMATEIDKQDKKIKKLNFWLKFWKGMTGGVGLVGSTVIIVKEVKD